MREDDCMVPIFFCLTQAMLPKVQNPQTASVYIYSARSLEKLYTYVEFLGSQFFKMHYFPNSKI